VAVFVAAGPLSRVPNSLHIPKCIKEIIVGAVPKKRVSRSRQGNRRQHHTIKIPQLKICPQCRQVRQAHHVCLNCGTYRGREVLPIKSKRPAAE
jgi:large subunit ribosomal protein L32